MSLISLVYVSASKYHMSDQDLRDILEVARRKNTELGITGMLLYREGYFIQVLEGEDDKVMALYATIATDPRHDRVVTVYTNEIKARSFADWAMGFNKLGHESLAELEGFTDFMDGELEEKFLKNNGERALKLLQAFRDKTYF